MSEIKDTQHPNVEIAVENFGPIAKANIDLRPLTVFVGPSNTGKTYFATLVYALHGVFPDITGPRLLYPSGFEGVYDILEVLLRLLALKKARIFEDEAVQRVIEKLGESESVFKLSDLPTEMRDLLWTTIDDSKVFGNKLQVELKNYFDVISISGLRRLTEKQLNEMTVVLSVGEEHQGGWNIKMATSEADVIFSSSFNEDMILLPKGLAVSTDWSNEENLTFTFRGNLKFDFNEDRVIDQSAKTESQVSPKIWYRSKGGTQ